ncbi:hypothetical protein AB205_0114120, partial [Aquarana catesbeiana]
CPTLLAIPETGDLIDVSVEEEPPSKPPAEVLATGQRVQDLCPTPVAVSEAQGGKVAITSQQQIQGEKGEEEASLLPQRLAGAEDAESPAEVLATEQSATNLCPAPATTTEFQGGGAVGLPPQQLAGADGVGFPAEGLATGLSTAGLGPQLTEDGFPVKVDGTSVSTCIPQGCWAVGPDPQQHDGLSSVTRYSLQRQKGLQGEGPVQASPQRQVCSLREAEVSWVSNALFGTIYLGYCVGTGIRGLELLTNFGVNPSGVSSCVSLLPKGERCDRRTRGTQNPLESRGCPCSSSPYTSYV